MLPGDAHIVVTIWHGLFQDLQTRPTRHRRRNADDGVVLPAEPHHRLSKHILPIWRRSWFCGKGRAGRDIVRSEAMKFLRVLKSRLETLALLSQDMNDYGMI